MTKFVMSCVTKAKVDMRIEEERRNITVLEVLIVCVSTLKHAANMC